MAIEMQMLCGETRIDMITMRKSEIVPLDEKLRSKKLIQYGHVMRDEENVLEKVYGTVECRNKTYYANPR